MITIRHDEDDRFSVEIRHHDLVADQPVEDGGGDLGPTPTELFVASIAACAAYYARRFFARDDISAPGFRVDCDFRMSADRPARVAEITIDVALPEAFPEERREALQRVIDGCTVKNSIRIPPAINVALKRASRAA